MTLKIISLVETPTRQELDIHRLKEALVDIEELVDGYEDVDDGQPNLAMRVLTVARIALKREP